MAPKGTGRAVQGSIRSPIMAWRRYCIRTNTSFIVTKYLKKVRRLAIKSVLSQKYWTNKLVVVEALQFDAPKQKRVCTSIV